MTDEPYSLLDAIREEKEFSEELQAFYNEVEKKPIMAAMHREIASSFDRILRRYEKGKEFSLRVTNGKTTLYVTQGTRHLERDNPAVAKAKRNLDLLVGIAKEK